jgi:hypothetical protein
MYSKNAGNATRLTRPWTWLLILTICLLFLGVNGFIGGYLMLNDPYGAPMGMPVSMLERTLFQNFIVPGFWLIIVWGGGSFLALLGLWFRSPKTELDAVSRWTHEHWAWTLAEALGLGLLVWLTYQVFTLPAIAPIQYILFGLALLLVCIPLLPSMRSYYRLEQSLRNDYHPIS